METMTLWFVQDTDPHAHAPMRGPFYSESAARHARDEVVSDRTDYLYGRRSLEYIHAIADAYRVVKVSLPFEVVES
jgi:hypothetical protein